MAHIDTQQLEMLLSAGKTKEAGALIDTFLQGDLTAEQKGALYVELASVYTKTANKLDEKYLNFLKRQK